MLERLANIDPLTWVLILGALLVALSFWKLQKSPVEFDLRDLLMENGRVSKIAIVFLGSFALSGWIMIRLTLKGEMTEGYLTTFGAMWVTPLIARVVFNKTNGNGNGHP